MREEEISEFFGGVKHASDRSVWRTVSVSAFQILAVGSDEAVTMRKPSEKTTLTAIIQVTTEFLEDVIASAFQTLAVWKMLPVSVSQTLVGRSKEGNLDAHAARRAQHKKNMC